MTNFTKWKALLIAGVAVPALALTACSSDDDSGSSDSSGSGSSEGSQDSGDSSADIELEGAPDGFELTEPGSKLSFGEAAYVVTQAYTDEGEEPSPLEFWKVTAQEPEDLDVDAVELGEGEDRSDIESFVCLSYDLEFLGTGESTDPEGIMIVTEPDMGAVDDNGRGANSILFSAGDECGIHESDKLPSSQDELREGKVYQDAELSYAAVESAGGISPTGLSFTYDVDVPDLENADDIYWN